MPNQNIPQIIATLGPSSQNEEMLTRMIQSGADIIRLNFSWAGIENHIQQIELIQKASESISRQVPILVDLAGPRIQKGATHSYNHEAPSCITEQDIEHIIFGITHKVDYFGLSFVATASDVIKCKEIIRENGGTQGVVAKIERPEALENFDAILNEADAIMIARGDLGENIPLERLPFVQADLIKRTKRAHKPVIVATQMLFSMTENSTPTRAEVTDVANAILQGADAVMLSDETASGIYPAEAVSMMKKIINESEKHLTESLPIVGLTKNR